MSPPDFARVRREFPTLEKWTYLDVARKTPLARCAEQAMKEFCADVYQHAGDDAWSPANVESTRAMLSLLLGCRPQELSFTKNTTEGLNIAASAFELKPGDNIVLTDMEHVNNVWVWRHWEANGVEIRFAQNRDGRLPIEAFQEKIDDRTRVVSCAWVTYGNGYRVNLPELGKLCRSHGARLVVDGVQGACILNTPLSALGADMIAIGGHKGMLGLTGSGVLYTRAELIPEVRTPFVRPASAINTAAKANFDYVHDAHRFEGGNPNFLGLKVFRHSAQFLQSIGLANIEARVKHLTGTFLDMVKKRGIATQTSSNWDERCQIVNLKVADAKGLQAALRQRNIMVNTKDSMLRVSMSFFNNEDDLERLIAALPRT